MIAFLKTNFYYCIGSYRLLTHFHRCLIATFFFLEKKNELIREKKGYHYEIMKSRCKPISKRIRKNRRLAIFYLKKKNKEISTNTNTKEARKEMAENAE